MKLICTCDQSGSNLSHLLAQAGVENVEVERTDVVPVAMTIYGDLIVDLHIYVNVWLKPSAQLVHFTIST